jgi:hypothetical protein
MRLALLTGLAAAAGLAGTGAQAQSVYVAETAPQVTIVETSRLVAAPRYVIVDPIDVAVPGTRYVVLERSNGYVVPTTVRRNTVIVRPPSAPPAYVGYRDVHARDAYAYVPVARAVESDHVVATSCAIDADGVARCF